MVAVAALQEDVPQEDIAPTQELPLTQHLCQAMVVAAMAALAGVAVAITLGLVVPVATTLVQGEAVATTLASPLEASHPFLQAFQALATTLASPLEASHPFLQAF